MLHLIRELFNKVWKRIVYPYLTKMDGLYAGTAHTVDTFLRSGSNPVQKMDDLYASAADCADPFLRSGSKPVQKMNGFIMLVPLIVLTRLHEKGQNLYRRWTV